MVAGALALVSSPLAAAQISGKIVDEAGNPVPYVRVTVEGDQMVPTTTTVFSDTTGEFQTPDLKADYDPETMAVTTFRIGFEEAERNLEADGDDVVLNVTLKTKENVADQVPASAWYGGEPGDRDLHIAINECGGCHQMAAERMKVMAESLAGLSVEEKEQAWRGIVQYMRERALQMGPSDYEGSHLRWGLTEGSEEYMAAITPDGSFFMPKDEDWSVAYLARKLPDNFDYMTGYNDIEELGEYGVTKDTVIEEYSLPTFGWTREVSVAPGSPYVWFVELDKDRLGRLDPTDGSVKWVDVPGEGPQGPHTLNADADGNLWAALEESYSIGRYNPKTDKWDIFPPPEGVKFAITHDTAFDSNRHVVADEEGRIWLTLVGLNELWSVDLETKEVERHPLPLPEDETKFHAFVYGSIIEPDKSHIWWTQLHGFLGSFNIKEGYVDRIIPFPYGAAPRRMAIEPNGTLWVPLYGDGQLVKVDTEKGKILATYDMPDRKGASYSITWDPGREVVWVGTTNSDRVYRFDPKTERWTHYPLPRAEAFLRMIELDHETGDLWTSYSNFPIGPRDPEIYGRADANNMVVRIHPGD